LEQMTREQMLAEFGEPGVENAKVVDLITTEAATNSVVLVMVERRAWGASPMQFKQIEEKVNRYMGYALDGFLVQHHPEHEGKPVQIRLDCAEPPHGEAVKFVQAMQHAIEGHGLRFAINVLGAP
jgi:hypothetical protein